MSGPNFSIDSSDDLLISFISRAFAALPLGFSKKTEGYWHLWKAPVSLHCNNPLRLRCVRQEACKSTPCLICQNKIYVRCIKNNLHSPNHIPS